LNKQMRTASKGYSFSLRVRWWAYN